MPTPISNTKPSTCDPSISSCADDPPAAPAPAAAAAPRTVDIPPVVVTGDAGSKALLERYDASQVCALPGTIAIAATAAIPGAFAEGGPVSGFLASVNGGAQLRAFSDCLDHAEALESSALDVIYDCHHRGGNVSAGASPKEIICEVPR